MWRPAKIALTSVGPSGLVNARSSDRCCIRSTNATPRKIQKVAISRDRSDHHSTLRFSNQDFSLIDLFVSLLHILFLQWRRLVTQISPMLAVSDGNAAIKFYQAAFGAELLWHLGGGGHVVAGLSIDDAKFFLAHEAPDYGTRGPSSVGFTTVRIELFVDDPLSVHHRALAAGAIERGPVVEHEHQTIGPNPIKRMLQGAVIDPFGHMWLIGKFLE